MNEMKKILLVGNPNVGKSAVFSALTGQYVTVSNYPGTTVEIVSGKSIFDLGQTELSDTPGANSFIPHSEDEIIARNILLDEKAHLILQVADSKNLKRSLLATLQLIEMGMPLVVALNMNDEAKQRGLILDEEKLSSVLGVDFVKTVAIEKEGIPELIKKFKEPRKSDYKIKYNEAIENAIKEMDPLLPDLKISKRYQAVMILSGDESFIRYMEEKGLVNKAQLEKLRDVRRKTQAKFASSLGFIINRAKRRIIENISAEVTSVKVPQKNKFADFLGKLMIHPVYGIFFVAAVLVAAYYILGKFTAGVCVDFLQTVVFEQYINPFFSRLFQNYIPWNWLRDMFVGEYGLITVGLTYAFAILLPIIGVYFFFFSIIEDSGYLPRLAVVSNKLFKAMGLNGRAILPMVLGLGCVAMATLTARILETKKERLLVVLLLALGIPCSAQLGVAMSMLAGISLKAVLAVFFVVVSQLFLVGLIASKVIPGGKSDFITEIPPLRLPRLMNVGIKTYHRVKWFLKEAVPIFLFATFLLFIMDKTGFLNMIKDFLSPIIVRFLDLPPKATESFIMGFLRRDYAAAGLFDLQLSGMLDPTQIVVSMVVIILFVPCLANLIMITKEYGIMKAIYMCCFIFPFAVLVGGIVNFILRVFSVNLL